MNPLSITTASGRRVSILCDDEYDSRVSSSCSARSYSTGSYFPPLAMNPTPPLSPDHRRPCLTERSDSFSSSVSSSSVAHSPLTPPTPECLSLPPLEKMIGHRPSFERRLSCSSAASSAAASPMLSPRVVEDELPASPKSPNSGSAVIKRSTRKYTCNCGKSFTTSGHLARHTRIHTGEKNYECPEPGCGARFSRQDNCMQHYRTHQSGGAKRSSRKKRSDAPSLVSHHSSRFVPQLHNLPESAFNAENSLAALASVAISSYQ